MKHLITLCLSLLLSSALFGQNGSDFGFDFDYAQFGYDSTSNYVEFYYSFNQSNLTINKTDSSTFSKGILKISIEDTSSNKMYVDKEWNVVNEIRDSSAIDRSLVGALGFVLPAGTYRAVLEGRDAVNQQKKKSITEYLKIVPFWKNSAAISDLELASRIIPDSPNKNSVFYKNTYEIIPMTIDVFGENQPVLFYYTELYNLNNLPKGDLKLKSIVSNSKGKVISVKTKSLTNSVNSRVEVGTVVLNKFPTDSYLLTESVIDSAANFGISSSKRFYVYNPSVPQADTVYSGDVSSLGSEFNTMGEDELDRIFDESKYVATSGEIDQYDKLTNIDGKRKFLYNFWKNRDPNPSTPINEAYQDYMRRVEICNDRYGSMGKEGWKTDRGRVYLTYGEPSEIERYPNQQNTKPYEIWHYNEIEGGVIFVFADVTGFSQYILVNSTKRGELRDDDWERRISTN
jgi:GWxTD domain-containing protein